MLTSTEPLPFWTRPRLNPDLEWETGKPVPAPVSKDDPCYGSVFSEHDPRQIAYDFGWAHVAAQGTMTMMLCEGGVWWELAPSNLHDGSSPCRVAELWPPG